MSFNGISIIICCYNAAMRIQPTLQALQKQVDPGFPWELIVVDNASTDTTGEVAKRVWEQNPVTRLTVVNEEQPGLIHARHKGLAEARYEIVSFIDDDNWVEEKWVVKIGEVFSMDPQIAAAGGQSLPAFEKTAPEWFPRYQQHFAVGKQMDRSGYIENEKGFLWGAGLSFRKSIWERLKLTGYQNLTVGRQGKNMMAGEDTELCYAFRLMGYRLYYRDDLVLTHYMPDNRMQFAYLLKMTFGFGLAHARLNCYRELLDPGFKLHAWWYEWIAAQKKRVTLWLKRFSASGESREMLAINQAYFAGYARQLFLDRSRLRQYTQQLRKIVASIEKQA